MTRAMDELWDAESKITIEQARDAKRAVQSLIEARTNGEGITKDQWGNFAVLIMLEEEPDYPLPKSVNGVPVITEVVGIIRPQ